ncbi:hypothetical protein POM88_016807 [Heracleum sosnowskyi]|uniref:Uncharacterized protein n=1 Tax=Heracleum sosnowskyi TaxID=360622 RepID=A0AAD8IMD1_9APIA|nr:hypothetical protein POM88_016807 [Heracleum sosnowskyi]
MDGFNNFIDNANLLEIALVNSEFTWFGPGGKKSRLDRALVSPEWWSKGSWLLKTSYRKGSDHRVLSLSLQVQNWGPVPFRIFDCWMKDTELAKCLEDQINKDVQSGCIDLLSVLRRARLLIKNWSKLGRNNVDDKIKEMECSLDLSDNDALQNVNAMALKDALSELYEQNVAC